MDDDLTRPLLAIDTSSGQGAAALYDGDHLSFRSWAAERSHTTTLLAEIHHLLDAASVAVTDLGAIGVATGPGAFTGLRVGFGIAKGLHLATKAPLVGLSTLEATALPHGQSEREIVATVGAGRGRYAWARFQPEGQSVLESRPARNGSVEELVAELSEGGPYVVAGEVERAVADTLAALGNVTVPPPALRVRHPAAFAELLWRRWLARSFDDPVLLEPVYLSRSARG